MDKSRVVCQICMGHYCVYHESRNRELKTRPTYDFEVIGSPSVFKLTRGTTVMVRVLPTFSFRVTENAMYGLLFNGCRCNQRKKAIINKRKRGPEREYIYAFFTINTLFIFKSILFIGLLFYLRYPVREMSKEPRTLF
jgi:hypothetical protein